MAWYRSEYHYAALPTLQLRLSRFCKEQDTNKTTSIYLVATSRFPYVLPDMEVEYQNSQLQLTAVSRQVDWSDPARSVISVTCSQTS